MFTGIVEEVGEVLAVRPLEGGRELLVGARLVLEGMRTGDSVAIDGACHTVSRIEPTGFRVQSVATTLQRTTLGDFLEGRRVNLERAVPLGERLGGHLVQGHVDAVGVVRRIEPRGEHVLIDFELPPIVAEVTILHGSIALNGVSLTINALPTPGIAQVSIVPHTWAVTAFADLQVGSGVNLEGDLIGKYVRHLLARGRSVPPAGVGSEHLPPDPV